MLPTFMSGASNNNLPSYAIKTFTLDATSQNNTGKYFAEKNLDSESWYSSAKAVIPLFARKSGAAYICTISIEYNILRVQADMSISGVTVGVLVIL